MLAVVNCGPLAKQDITPELLFSTVSHLCAVKKYLQAHQPMHQLCPLQCQLCHVSFLKDLQGIVNHNSIFYTASIRDCSYDSDNLIVESSVIPFAGRNELLSACEAGYVTKSVMISGISHVCCDFVPVTLPPTTTPEPTLPREFFKRFARNSKT
jgi:hypothetical protein